LNHFLFRYDTAYAHHFPDRAEFFWAAGPRGPSPTSGGGERCVDYQDIRFRFELGGDRFSVATDVPLRFLNPALTNNTGGFGDMWVTTKTVLIDGENWQMTQFFRTYLNTGSASHGTGTGHVSLEPGLLLGYRWRERTFLHSELKYWFALGGNPDVSGQVLRYGIGMSHVAYDADDFAIIPTLELVGWSVQDGAQTPPVPLAEPVPVNGTGILNIYPGTRLVFDTAGDWGMFEAGLVGGFALSNSHWYESILRFDLRWSY
jgi:hypothetical protein